jgi:hypothetical protein
MNDTGARRRGTLGWATGVASTALGAMGLGAVLCLWFPALLTTPELREVHDMRLVRPAIAAALALAFVLGAASLLLRRTRTRRMPGVNQPAYAACATAPPTRLAGGGGQMRGGA